MAYHSSVHESTGYRHYRLMFGEECTLPMDVGLPRKEPDLPDQITSPYAVWVSDALEVACDQVHQHLGQAVRKQKQLYDRRAVRRLFATGDWVLSYYSPAKKCKLDSAWVGPYLVVSLAGWAVGIQLGFPCYPCTLSGFDENSTTQWFNLMDDIRPVGATTIPVLGASTMGRTTIEFPSVAVLPSEEGARLSKFESVLLVKFSLVGVCPDRGT